jgi:hypothetical protein
MSDANIYLKINDVSNATQPISNALNNLDKQVNKIAVSELNVRKNIALASRFLGLIIGNIKNAQAAQILQIGQQIVGAGLAIAQIQIQAKAAWITGNPFQAIMLESIAGLMAFNQIKSIVLQQQSKATEEYISNINTMTELYS